jgi:hypothetical protein
MTKRKAAAPFISVPRTDHFMESGNQDMVYRQWLVSVRRIVAKFFTEKSKRSDECADDASKSASMTPLSVHDQLQLLMRVEMEDCRYGPYQQPVRYRPNVDHLFRRAKEDVREPSDQSDDQST